MQILEDFFVNLSNLIWGTPLLILLLGGGLFFTIYSRFLPFRYFRHAINVLRGKYDDPNDPGQINHFQALSSALAATIGMGNISGVAVAIVTGGPGTLFWMWVSAFVGITTKYFTCSLAIMYRGRDSEGELQGGPMYVVTEGLGMRWKPLATFFCAAGIIGMLPIFQANQLTQVLKEVVLVPNKWVDPNSIWTNFFIGLVLIVLVSGVIFGGIKRIAQVAARLVPSMVILYVASVTVIMVVNWEVVPQSFLLIFTDAFSAKAVLGGAIGSIIIAGARRAAFSNEAGIGTAPMAHGAAKTNEPIREGLVAMMGPAIDTLVVCTMTAMAILTTGLWESGETNGVTLTAAAFENAIPGVGQYVLVLCVLIFAVTSMFSYSYYGTKCFAFLFGAEHKHWYNYFYVATILFGATASITAVISVIDAVYAMMAIPTMVSAIALAPKVMEASKEYFKRLGQGQ